MADMTDKSDPSFLQTDLLPGQVPLETVAPAALTPNPTYARSRYEEEYRPPVEERWIEGMRQEPAIIEVHTTWLYSAYDERVIVPAGRTRHPFSRGGQVAASSLPEPSWSSHNLADYLNHAVSAFGDDADLEIIVRRKRRAVDVQDIANRHMEDLGARLPLGVAIPDEAGRAIRGTILAALEEALL